MIDMDKSSLLLGQSPTMLVVGGLMVLYLVVSLLRKDKAPGGYKLPPVFSSSIPVIGNFVEFARDPLGFVAKGKEKCGQVFTIDMVAEKCTFLIGADAHKAFFEATDEELDQGPVYRFMTPIFGKGIVYDCPLKKRRQQMRALGRCLRPSILKTYPQIIANETKDYLAKHWGESGTVDLHKTFAQLIINTGSATLLGPELRGAMFDEMFELYEMLDQGLTPLSIFLPHAPTKAHAKRDLARKEISKLFSRIIEQRRNDPEAASKTSDLIKLLMEFKYSDGSKFTDDEIAGMILAALFASQHTSSIVSTWSTLFLLENMKSGDGQWMEKVLDEIASLEPTPGAFGKAEGLDSSVVNKEKQLYNVIKESIRMHPPLIMLMRRVTKPITMADGTYIPVGHRAMVSNAVAQRLPEVFENPNTWDPSRWDEFNIAKLPKYSFIGFGAGLHTCMGESFAFLQIRTILSVILSSYEMELLTPFPEPNLEAMVVPPKGPNMVRFKRRKTPLTRSAKKTSIPQSISTTSSEKPEATTKPAPKASAAADEDSELSEFTKEQVARHNSKESCWIIVDGKVYDVTTFLDLHQGGDESILNWGGKDASIPVKGDQHPATFRGLLDRYEIGTLIE